MEPCGHVSGRLAAVGGASAVLAATGRIHAEVQPGAPGGSYPGPYEVTPETWEQTLATAGKAMRRDVTVHEIPYGEVSNEAGGRTATIAS